MTNFQNGNLLKNFLVITKTAESGQVEVADITCARQIIQSEKLAQAAEEFPKLLKVYAEACGRVADPANIHSEHRI